MFLKRMFKVAKGSLKIKSVNCEKGNFQCIGFGCGGLLRGL